MKQREGDDALTAHLLKNIWADEFIKFEDHMDLWVACKGCFYKGDRARATHHTSLFMSDYTKWQASGVLPEYLSDNGRSLLTTGRCSSCMNERAARITRLVEKPRCMTPEAAAVVVDAAMFRIGCTEGTVRAKIELDKAEKKA